MPVGLERFVRVMTFGQGVTDGLVSGRNGKVVAELLLIKDAIDAAKAVGFGVASVQGPHDALEQRRAGAMALNGNKARYAALDPLKAEARTAAKTAAGKVEEAIKLGKEIQVEMRMAEGWCRKFAVYVKKGPPKTGDEDPTAPPPDLSYLDKPGKDTLQLIKRMRKLLKTDSEKAVEDWHKGWQPYNAALRKLTREIINPPLLKKANDLIVASPDGPEAKMKQALGRRFETSLVQVAQTAEAFGINNDKLSPGEQVAVFTYTKQDYQPMNRLLLGIPPMPSAGEKAELEIKCAEAAKAIAKLDAYVGLSSRGESEWPGADEQYVAGNVFVAKAFWSSGLGFKFSGKYQLSIDGKSGKDVAGFSNSPNEAEILFAPGTTFRVLSREDVSPTVVKIRIQEV